MLIPVTSVVLRNPLYFIFLILLGVGAYVTYTLNLWGPMINMANAASVQALEEGKKRLREFLENSEGGRRVLEMEGRHGHGHGEAYEMRRMNGGERAKAKAKMDGAASGDDEGVGEDI